MKKTICSSRWKPKIAIACSAVVLGMLASLSAEPSHPAWWGQRNVTSGAAANNKGVAVIGQLKHMGTAAHAEMEASLPGGAGFALPFSQPPANPSATWLEDQKKALNLGQLKAVAKPFYDRLNSVAPDWLEQQLQTNGLATLNTHYFQDSNGFFTPWNPSTPVAENYRPANVGQLKLVFCLRFAESLDGDSIPDLVEIFMYGDSSGDGTTTDFDGDGLTDAQEMVHGTALLEFDTDHDGVPDGAEVSASGDPLVPNTVSETASALEVWTVLE